MSIIKRVAPTLIVSVILVTPELALAQGAAQAAVVSQETKQNVVDLTQLLIAVVSTIGSILGVVLAAVIPIVVNKYIQDKNAAVVVEKTIMNSLGKLQQAGVDYATEQVKNYRPGVPVPAALQPALQYVADHAGDEAKRLGLTREAIADKIVSRLGLENIETNKALTASASTLKIDGLEAPVVVPPLAPVPSTATAVIPEARPAGEVKS